MTARILAAFAAALLLAACGGGGGGSSRAPTMQPPPVEPPAPPPMVAQPVPESSQPEPEPEPIVPPAPSSVEVNCGINICMAEWDNPFGAYEGHGRTLVFRSTVNDFATATQIGVAVWLLYTDDTARGGQTYYYWVQFESETGDLGPVSRVASAMPARDPSDVYEEFRQDLVNSPLAQALSSPISLPAPVLSELQRIRDELGDLSAELDPPPLPPAPTGLSLARTGTAATDIDESDDHGRITVHGLSVAVTGWGFWAGKSGARLFSIGIDGSSTAGFDSYANGTLSGSNPVTGSAVWLGGVNALDPERGAIYGNARIAANLSAATVDVSFTRFTRGRADMSWSGLRMQNGVFQDSTITGTFFGDGHEGVAGRFERDRLIGVFGALRQ